MFKIIYSLLSKYILFFLGALFKLFPLPRMSFSHIFVHQELIRLSRLISNFNFSLKASLSSWSVLCSLSYEFPQLFKPLLQWFPKCDPWTSISSASLGNLTGKQILRLYSRPTESELWVWHPSICIQTSPLTPVHFEDWESLF